MQQKIILNLLRSKTKPNPTIRTFFKPFHQTRNVFPQFKADILPIYPPQKKEEYGSCRFFEALQEHKKIIYTSYVPDFLSQQDSLKKLLYNIDHNTQGNYVIEHFIYWLSRYAAQQPKCLENYFSNKVTLDLSPVCKDFINFCFKHKISLDPDSTLQSFSDHNQLSDNAIKRHLEKNKPKDKMNILGFGLDEGSYEKTLARFLIDRGIAKSVNIYGFDPYAHKADGIHYLTQAEISSGIIPKFDLVVARWVLHHVALQHRWESFIKCLNNCNPDSMALIVEHGFLKKEHTPLDKKLYYLLNAFFDIVANIGLRPRYFTNTAPDLGKDFFIAYLEPKDFLSIKEKITVQTTQNIYEIGPGFPNQTISCMHIAN